MTIEKLEDKTKPEQIEDNKVEDIETKELLEASERIQQATRLQKDSEAVVLEDLGVGLKVILQSHEFDCNSLLNQGLNALDLMREGKTKHIGKGIN